MIWSLNRTLSTPQVTTMGFLWQTSTPVIAPLWKGWHRMVNSETFAARDTEPDPAADDIGPSDELMMNG